MSDGKCPHCNAALAVADDVADVKCSNCHRTIPLIRVRGDGADLCFIWLGREVYRLRTEAGPDPCAAAEEHFSGTSRCQLEAVAAEVQGELEEEKKRLSETNTAGSAYSRAVEATLRGIRNLLRKATGQG